VANYKGVVYGIGLGLSSGLLFAGSQIDCSSEGDDKSSCWLIVIRPSSIVRIDIKSMCIVSFSCECSSQCSSETQTPSFVPLRYRNIRLKGTICSLLRSWLCVLRTLMPYAILGWVVVNVYLRLPIIDLNIVGLQASSSGYFLCSVIAISIATAQDSAILNLAKIIQM